MQDLPTLENSHVKLIPPVLTSEDIKKYHTWLEDPKVKKGIGSGLEEYTEQEVSELLTKWKEDPLKHHWFIFLKKGEIETVVGDANLNLISMENEREYHEFFVDPMFKKNSKKAEIGILIAGDYQRKGIGKLATKSLIDYGFNIKGLNAIYASIYLDNEHSLNLFERIGFKRIGLITEEESGKDEWIMSLEK